MQKSVEVLHNFVIHTIEPIWNKNSKVLILGSIPSPKSREVGFYYSHPQNRFWKVIAEVMSQEVPTTIEEKKQFLLDNKIAMWDVLQSCKIINADDNSISEPIVNDISRILAQADIKAVFTTGKKATDLYRKHCVTSEGDILPIYLPSTSSANCRMKFEDMVKEYRIIVKACSD